MIRPEFRQWLGSDQATEQLSAALAETKAEEVVATVTPQPISGPAARPDAAWVKGICPLCGDAVVSNVYYVGGKGYLIVHECWGSLRANSGQANTCDYRRVL